MPLPDGLRDTDDVVTTIVANGALVHRPIPAVTACGQPMWGMHKVSVGHMATLSCRYCPTCWPQAAAARASTWARLLDLAYPSHGFRHINSSARYAGHPDGRSSR